MLRESTHVHLVDERADERPAQGPIALYTEIHGNNHRDAASRIEIATVGVDLDEAIRLRTLLELVRDAHLRANPQAQRLDILVEPADPVRYAASGAKRDGILRLPQRALHIELPRAARTEWRDTYTAILADFVSSPQRVRWRHVKGINVLYGNGSAKWVDLSTFKTPLEVCQEPFTLNKTLFNTNQITIWKLLDKQ